MSTNTHKKSASSENTGFICNTPSSTSRKSCNRILLEWSDLAYSVKQKKHRTKILKGVSGFANPGQILAIMGSSGSGKTSLVSILSNQIIPQRNIKISGTVSINGTDIKKVDYSIYSRYVMQQDIVLPTLTPREALTYAARLKIKGNHDFITERVNQVIEDLKLTKIADKLIGNELIKGLSGGEKKRVCIGLELISEPQILILDEPTSGLDSFTAELVIKLMKQQAQNDKTIVVTIHQPSSNIFAMFDRLILMVEGNFVYQGCASKSLEYFNDIGYNCPDMMNPPDYYMRVLFIRNRTSMTDDESQRLEMFTDTYKKNEEIVFEEINKNELLEIDSESNSFRAGFFIEISVLLQRAWKNTMRNPMMVMLKFMQLLTMAIILDLIFHDLGYNMKGVQNRQGVLFNSVIHFVMTSSQTNSMSFPIERPIFLKDYKEALYGVTPYILAKMITELPLQIICTLLYSVVFYFALDLNLESADKFFIFFGIMLLIHLCGAAYGNLAGAFSKDVLASTIWGPTIAAPLMMFGGFFSNGNSFSSSFYWIKYVSAYYFGFVALAINEFTDLDLGSDVMIPPLKSLGINGEIWENAGSLLLIVLGCIVLTICALKYYGEQSKS
ncbi:hypothetical protein SteCoe_8875 [Stentor coeruleus]|uniref:ABC transporter domain-containing protein n=1 Tax=Stentor coeruleus TaxID=5963 RepID=A0A1R2CJ80_9CILI|nr:hypothetical protein SteCoe_8875 [Stentor coeruleus]